MEAPQEAAGYVEVTEAFTTSASSMETCITSMEAFTTSLEA